ncbi:uncharacterized protein LOC6575704 [Drosophila mojavensis]|uniref:CCDC113/CCDC96 coiled-coil domain-containing protein n=1 Tax=Drosophila mojavensis TaxID=7230 RepID=B4KGV1_DROMO|nr:uncharacterized protein LOC6575704 [Drosophila mojavensis]EDW11151.1 uncharacterized protein Dmoj_GI16997 [Drosophila mojavensis]
MEENTEAPVETTGEPDSEMRRATASDNVASEEATQAVDGEASKVDGEQTMEVEIDEDDLDDEARAKLEKKKREKKREMKRQANLVLKSHFQDMAEENAQAAEKSAPQPSSTEQDAMGESKSSVDAEGGAGEGDDVDDVDDADDAADAGDTGAVSDSGAVIEIDDEEKEDKSPVESSSDEEDYSRRACPVSFKGDFFQNFYFPSLSDITTESETEEAEEAPAEEKEPEKETPTVTDTGKVVDPLGGEPRLSEKEEEPAGEEQQAQPQSEEESEQSSSSSISFDWPFPLEDEAPPPPVVDATDYAMEMLIEMDTTLKVVPAASDTELEQLRLERANRQVCVDLLFRLIDDAVEAAEYVDPLKILQSKLDKHKLLAEVHRLLSECLGAKQYNSDLTNKMFDYYRRVGQLRCFDPLPASQERKEYLRHREALTLLDHLKKKAADTKKKYVVHMASVTMDLNYVRKIALTSVDSLENCVRTTLLRKDFEVMPRIVEQELRRMQNLRNEVSDSRLWLITRQHTLGRLIERKRQFDQITPELTMDQFLNAQRDVTALGTKVEERNYELNRMRDRCTKHVHQLAFIREKTSMISATLMNHREDLDEKLERQSELRDQLLALKIEHSRLKDQKAQMHEKSGLLYRTALLHDFDKTVEHVEGKRIYVSKLRDMVRDLESNIAIFEKEDQRSSYLLSSMKQIRKNEKKNRL